MTAVPVLKIRRVWVCPNGCSVVSVTNRGDVHQQVHVCRAFGGLSVPLVDQAERVKVTVHEREDFVGDEIVTTVDGRPVMAVSVTREDGEDRMVYAPLAHMIGEN